jgi:hypothetical protein
MIKQNDWVLTTKMLDKLGKPSQLRTDLASRMGVSEPAVTTSVKTTAGRSVAKSYDGMSYLMEVTKLKEEEIRELVESEFD